MIKRLLLILSFMLILPVLADTKPYYIDNVPQKAIGLFQTGEALTIYTHPEANSDVVKSYAFDYKAETMPENTFAVLINAKKLGFLYVTDIGDENWVEVIYDKKSGARGWVQTEDRFQFLPWISFYNMYGRKYGLRMFKDTPDSVEVLHAKSEDLSQNLGKINYVKQIRVSAIRGNWALVSVLDIDRTPKTGYLKWRDTDGTIYAFPDIK